MLRSSIKQLTEKELGELNETSKQVASAPVCMLTERAISGLNETPHSNEGSESLNVRTVHLCFQR